MSECANAEDTRRQARQIRRYHNIHYHISPVPYADEITPGDLELASRLAPVWLYRDINNPREIDYPREWRTKRKSLTMALKVFRTNAKAMLSDPQPEELQSQAGSSAETTQIRVYSHNNTPPSLEMTNWESLVTGLQAQLIQRTNDLYIQKQINKSLKAQMEDCEARAIVAEVSLAITEGRLSTANGMVKQLRSKMTIRTLAGTGDTSDVQRVGEQ